MENEFIITPEMVAQMKDALKQAQEFEEGMKERLEIATKKYNSLIRGLAQKTGYDFDFERFVGFVSYHKIDWKPLNYASFERLLCEFYKEEMNILNSFLDNNTPIDENRILDIKRKGKDILSNSTPPHQAEVTGYHSDYSEPQLENLHGKLIEDRFLDPNTKSEHFKNAFNGKVLARGFKPLKWIEPTMGAVLFFIICKKKPQWTKYSYLFESANYKQLLSQSRPIGTFDNLKIILENIIL